MFRSLTVLLTAAALAAFSWPALAQAPGQPCSSHAEIIGKLASDYREKRVGYGILADGRLMEMFAATGGTTWSLVITWPTGMSCLVLVGQRWQTVASASDLIRRIRIVPTVVSPASGEGEI
jgi:hypothetical protein